MSGIQRARLIKKFAIGLTLAVVAGLGVAAALPRTWKVERSILIAAPAEKIVPLVVDLKRWQDWSPWTRAMDPALRNIYEGQQDGVGAKWSWLGPQMGSGKIEIVAVDAQSIEIEECIESAEPNARAWFRFSAEGEGTRVTWRDEGTLPPLGGLFRATVEEELGAHFEKGLSKLKGIVESKN